MDFTNCPPRSLRQTLAAAQKMTSRWELANNLVALDLLSTVFGFISFGDFYLTQEMKKWTKTCVCIYSFQKDCLEIFKHVFGHWICPIVSYSDILKWTANSRAKTYQQRHCYCGFSRGVPIARHLANQCRVESLHPWTTGLMPCHSNKVSLLLAKNLLPADPSWRSETELHQTMLQSWMFPKSDETDLKTGYCNGNGSHLDTSKMDSAFTGHPKSHRIS